MDDFKQQIAADNSAVFLNPSEFGEPHKINGVDMIVVLDTDLIEERQKHSYAEFVDGVNKSEILLFVEKNNFDKPPIKDSKIKVDNRYYIVDKISENMGVLELTLIINSEKGTPL